MKKNGLLFSLIACVLLAAALLLSVTALIAAKSEAKAASEQVQALTGQIQTLEEQNQALRLQLSYQNATWFPTEELPAYGEAYDCTLMVDGWEKEGGTLKVSVFAQAFLEEDVPFTARLELRRGDAVLESQPVTLDTGEAAGSFEAEVTVSFSMPEIGADEELQLWLAVQSAGSDPLFACGAGWYLEDGQLMLITG